MFGSKARVIEKLKQDEGKVKYEPFNFERIRILFDKTSASENVNIIGERTCNDLDFEDFFIFSDRTTSAVGQQYLYRKMRIAELYNFTAQEMLADFFEHSPEVRLNVKYHLSKLKNHEAAQIASLIYDEPVKQPRWLPWAYVLSILNLACLVSLFFSDVLMVLAIIISAANACIHIINKRILFFYIHSLPLLLELNKVAKKLFAYNIPVANDDEVKNSSKVFDSIRNRMQFFRVVVGLESDFAAFLWYAIELVKMLFLVEPIFLYKIFSMMDGKQQQLAVVLNYVGEIDAAISVLEFRNSLPYHSKANFMNESGCLDVKELYHPLIDGAIKNSIGVNGKSVLITGSNMSGKTTFIRALGLSLLSAQTINTCFAKEFIVSNMQVHTLIRVSDDLSSNKSYYLEEVLAVKELLKHSTKPVGSLFLLDEIFKGTNTIERIAAGKAVLDELAKNGNIVFVSTHDIELAELLKESYDLYHFCEQVNGEQLDFDYRLKRGVLKTRNAIKILEMNGYPLSVVEDARRVSKTILKPGILCFVSS